MFGYGDAPVDTQQSHLLHSLNACMHLYCMWPNIRMPDIFSCNSSQDCSIWAEMLYLDIKLLFVSTHLLHVHYVAKQSRKSHSTAVLSLWSLPNTSVHISQFPSVVKLPSPRAQQTFEVSFFCTDTWLQTPPLADDSVDNDLLQTSDLNKDQDQDKDKNSTADCSRLQSPLEFTNIANLHLIYRVRLKICPLKKTAIFQNSLHVWLRNFVWLFSRVDCSLHYCCTFYKILLICIEMAGSEVQSTIFGSHQPAML